MKDIYDNELNENDIVVFSAKNKLTLGVILNDLSCLIMKNSNVNVKTSFYVVNKFKCVKIQNPTINEINLSKINLDFFYKRKNLNLLKLKDLKHLYCYTNKNSEYFIYIKYLKFDVNLLYDNSFIDTCIIKNKLISFRYFYSNSYSLFIENLIKSTNKSTSHNVYFEDFSIDKDTFIFNLTVDNKSKILERNCVNVFNQIIINNNKYQIKDFYDKYKDELEKFPNESLKFFKIHLLQGPQDSYGGKVYITNIEC